MLIWEQVYCIVYRVFHCGGIGSQSMDGGFDFDGSVRCQLRPAGGLAYEGDLEKAALVEPVYLLYMDQSWLFPAGVKRFPESAQYHRNPCFQCWWHRCCHPRAIAFKFLTIVSIYLQSFQFST